MTTTKPTDAAAVAAAYFEAWKADDFDTFRTLLADDMEFEGPMAHIHGADECVAGIKGMSQIKTDIVIKKVFVDGDDVVTWFELHTKVAEPILTANWSHVENGKITHVRVVFDARPLA